MVKNSNAKNMIRLRLRCLLVLAAAWIMVLGFTVGSYAAKPVLEDDYTGKTIILQSNDVHGKLDRYQFIAGLRDEYVKRGADVYMIDCGDFSQGNSYVVYSKGASAITMMNAAGYDLVTLGNHDFDYGYDVMQENLDKGEFDTICSNVMFDDGGALLEQEYIVKDFNGLKVGFFGLVTPTTKVKVHPAMIKGIRFLDNYTDPDIFEAAQKTIDKLRNTEKADIVICLTHLGVDLEGAPYRSTDLYENTTGIDFILDGHSHTVMTAGPDNEPIMQTGTKFMNIGVVQIDQATKKIDEWHLDSIADETSPETVPTSEADFYSNEEVAAIADEIIKEVDEAYGEKVAESEVFLNGFKSGRNGKYINGNRDGETNMGDLITDAMRYEVIAKGMDLDVDDDHVVAIANGGSIRASIRKGDIALRDIKDVLPFGNTLAAVYVSGEDLLEVLEASTFCIPEAIGGFPQVSGIDYTIDTTKAYDAGDPYPGESDNEPYYAPKSIQRVTINSINGKPFVSTDTYCVVANDFCVAGGDTYYALSRAEKQFDTGMSVDVEVADYIINALGGVVGEDYKRAQGRITVKVDEEEAASKAASDILSKMTVREKITQCFMMSFRQRKEDGKTVDITSLDDDSKEALETYKFGGVIFFAENIKKTDDTLNLVKDMQTATIDAGGQPLMIATDQEGGLVYRLGSGTALPGNMALGAAGDVNYAKISGQIIGSELSALGINTTLAPVLDVNNNANNPIIGIRSFGDDANMVGELGNGFIGGLKENNIIGCAKHFPGHGDTDTDSHSGLPLVNKKIGDLYRTELLPFQMAIDSGVDMIMTAHIVYPKVDSSTIAIDKNAGEGVAEIIRPATLSHKMLTDILRGEMEFNGVVITDAMNMAGISDFFTEEHAVIESFSAGADMICMPVTNVEKNEEGETVIIDNDKFIEKLEKTISAVEEKAESDPDFMARIDEAAVRVLKLKYKKGILDYDDEDYTIEKAESVVGCDENKQLESEIASKAVTVVRNDKGILPYRVSKDTKVLMLCPYNNERAQMVMGLNRAKAAGIVPKSVEVRVYRFSSNDCKAEGELKENIDWADLVILNSEVVDSEDMAYGWFTSAGVKNLTEYCRTAGKTSVVMSVQNPYDVQLYPDADAVIAVYGCKGSTQDVTEELLNGEITAASDACGPNIIAGVEAVFGLKAVSGRLPVNVPVFDKDSGTFTDEIIYKRGFGLSYDALGPSVEHGELTIGKDVYVYTGKKIVPSVKVTNALGQTLEEGKDYTVRFKDNKKVGTAQVNVTGKGAYTGTIGGSFKIVPKKAKIKAVKSGHRSIRVRMTTAPSKKGASSYQIAYRVKGTGAWKYKTAKSKNAKIRDLKRGKKYEVKARAFKKVKGEKYYGSWSKTKTTVSIK